nr:hypothetical protein [uncultured Holophaga sp.]
MSWTEWIASQHTFFMHLPVAAAVMLVIPLIASQRMGRGIRPWWLLSRYLAIFGFLGLLLTMVSGYASVPGASPLRSLLPGRAATTLVYHQFFSTLSLVLGILTLIALFRKRRDHESLGLSSLILGLLWAASILVAHRYGNRITGPAQPPPPQMPAPAAPPVRTPHTEDPEAKLPIRILDYPSLTPIQDAPMRSKPHGDRWIRTWITPSSAEAYRKGEALPEGTLAVLSTLEDRWGRPSFEPGPLYALEIRNGRPQFTFYWGEVPESHRSEIGGAQRAYWRGDAPGLTSCLACHAQGAAPLSSRSHWGVPRKAPASTP